MSVGTAGRQLRDQDHSGHCRVSTLEVGRLWNALDLVPHRGLRNLWSGFGAALDLTHAREIAKENARQNVRIDAR